MYLNIKQEKDRKQTGSQKEPITSNSLKTRDQHTRLHQNILFIMISENLRYPSRGVLDSLGC